MRLGKRKVSLFSVVFILLVALIILVGFLVITSLNSISLHKKAWKQYNKIKYLSGNFGNVTRDSLVFQKGFQYPVKPVLLKPETYSPNGLGEFGLKVELTNLNNSEERKQRSSLNVYGVNQYLSEKISLHRTLKDPRPKLCQRHTPYNYSDLSSTSIVVVFYNEGMSTLLRTIYSILHNTPDCLVVEVILIDDFSDMPHLKKPLEDRIKDLPKIRLIRNAKREGIVRSRLIGLAQAVGEVVAYVDCHCECTVEWLEPLLVSIKEDNATIAVPVTDDIDSETFQYYYGADEPNIGGFTWDMFFHWRPLSVEQRRRRKDVAEPIRTPTISGGLFAVNKKYFLHIGSYDPGMDVWGGENVEVSFRTWMCGGRILIHPCSHIGHVSRNINTYSRKDVWKNVKRVAEVWLDGHFKKIFYNRLQKSKHLLEYGDVSSRRILKEKLHCHDFDWYLKNIFPEKYIPENRKGYSGSIQSVPERKYCVDRSGNGFLPYLCHGMSNQFFELNSAGQLRNHGDCLFIDGKEIKVTNCPELGQPTLFDSKWTLSEDGLLRHIGSNLCLEMMKSWKANSNELAMKQCNQQNRYQSWKFEK